MKVKYLYIAYRKCILRHYDVTFCPIFFENVNLFSSYDGLSSHQIWFDLDEGKQSYRGGAESAPPPQVENVLKRPGEIGLSSIEHGGTSALYIFIALLAL